MRFSEFLQRKHSVDEALTPQHERKADKMVESGHDWYRSQFLKHNPVAEARFRDQPDTKRWTTRETVSLENSAGAPHADVQDFLQDKGYHITDSSYKKGVALKHVEVGDPSRGFEKKTKLVEHKIGRILEDHNADKDVTKKFVNDPFRVGKTTSKYDLVLTGHHHDVYGGSTNRSWTSCTDMSTEEAGTDHMKDEINNHTHHVYLVPHGGSVDHDAIARTSYKAHTGLMTGHQTLIPEHNVYGTAPHEFIAAAHKMVGSMFEQKPGEVYKKADGVYDDSHEPFVFPKDHKVSPETLDAVWKHGVDTKDSASVSHVAIHVEPGQKYKSKTLNDTSKGMNLLNAGVKTGDYDKMTSHVIAASQLIPNHFRLHQSEHIDNALNEGAKHFNINNPEHVETLLATRNMPNQLHETFRAKVLQNIEPAKTVEQYSSITKLHGVGFTVHGKSKRSGVDIAKEHQMGKYPLDAITQHHSDTQTLDHNTFTKAHASIVNSGLNMRKGDIHDHAMHYEKQGIPGMSDVITGLAKHIHVKTDTSHIGGTKDDAIAHKYMHMQPATRARIADAAGTDVKTVMKNGKAGVARYKSENSED